MGFIASAELDGSTTGGFWSFGLVVLVPLSQ
jgi:hypothetical protein